MLHQDQEVPSIDGKSQVVADSLNFSTGKSWLMLLTISNQTATQPKLTCSFGLNQLGTSWEHLNVQPALKV
jgi:hypothetical protein